MQSPAIKGIGQIHISISDYARAIRFYRDILELTLLFEVPEQSMAFFDCAGIRLYLGIPSSPEYSANSFLYYKVEDIQAVHTRLASKGVAFLNSPQCIHQDEKHQLWMAGFKDSEGNYAQLMEEIYS